MVESELASRHCEAVRQDGFARRFEKTVLIQEVLRPSLIPLDAVVTSPASNNELCQGAAPSGLAQFWIYVVRLPQASFRSPLSSTQWIGPG